MSSADRRVLRWFGLVERMDEYCTAGRVLMAQLCGVQVRGRPRLGWMDGVKEFGLGQYWNDSRGYATMHERSVRVESPGFTWPLLLGHEFFQTALLCSGCYHLAREGMPLHDAVGINCKKGATTENQSPAVKYMD